MGKKKTLIPHIPLKFEDAVQEFLKVKSPKKGKTSTNTAAIIRPEKQRKAVANE